MNSIVHQTGTFVPAGNGLMRYQSGLDFNKDELIDLKAYIEQMQKELAENPPQNPFGDDIPVAEFSKFREYLSGKELSAADPIQALEAATGRKISTDARYSATDEEAEYFRDKYGDTYSEEKAAELYYELADKGIVSRNDAFRASGVDEIRPLSSFRSITYWGDGPGYGLEMYLNRDIGFVSDKVYVKDLSRTDKDSPYKILWDNFKKTYHREINTWKDALQETIDFERYVKENRNTSDHVFQQHSDQVIEGLEKTKDVISRIFG